MTSGQSASIGANSGEVKLTVVGDNKATLGGAEIPGGGPQLEGSQQRLELPKRNSKEAAAEKASAAAPAAGTPNQVAKFASDGVSLINSAITEMGGNVGINVTVPESGLDYRHTLPPLFTRDVGTPMFVNTVAALQLGLTNAGSRNINVGPAMLFFGDNSAGTKSFLGRVAAAWENPTAGAEAGYLRFQVRANSEDAAAQTERMRITANGNVGIGTTTPSAKLHTAGGEILFENKWRTETTTVNPGAVPGTPNLIGGFLGTFSGGAWTGNRVTPGVVGATIGGGGFNGTLNLPNGSSDTGDLSNRVTGWFGTVGGGLNNRAGDVKTSQGTFATVSGGRSNTAGNLYTTVSGGFLNTASGREATVSGGFLNTASGVSATVSGGRSNAASGSEATVPGGLSNTASGNFSFAAGHGAKANHAGTFVWADATGAGLASTGNDQFLIRASGGVGINKNNPAGALDVAGNGFFSGNVGIGTNSVSSKLHLNVANSANPISAMSIDVQSFENTPNAVNSHFLQVRDIGGGATHFYIRGDGNVGIGTDSPDNTLSVNGTANKPGGGSWGTFSDERLKTIKGRFTPGLKAMLQLQPLRYEYKRDNALGLNAAGEHIGFGAQAVQQVIPEAVSQNDKGYLLVNNDPIMWTMLNAIKEQQQQIEQLKAELRRLQVSPRRHRRRGRS